MAKRVKNSLTAEEKRVVKALLADGWRNQDIQALVNTGRKATINGGRITGVKQDATQEAASKAEVAFFKIKKITYDPQTGLNQYDDERLVRSREAMILAVQVFNSPGVKFKTEVFTVLSNIAWTYLLHEFYERKGVALVEGGRSLVLAQMLDKGDCPLSNDIKNNLRAMKVLRDKVEHLVLGQADRKWSPIFQACCLNYDKVIRELFGESLTLSNELSFALQFAKPNIEQLGPIGDFAIPAEIEAIDAQLVDGLTDEEQGSIEFQFRVVYTLDSASKSQSHFQFVSPDSAEGKDIHNVLLRKVPADALYPFKPTAAAAEVSRRSGQKFTTTDHTKAWRLFKARPKNNVAQPEQTDKKYCLYHAAHGDYTYSEEWIEMLVEAAGDPERLRAIRAVNL